MYFKEFPQYLYDFKYGDELKTSIVKDITRNVRFRKEILENISLYEEYDIQDGDTPEIISEKFYGSPDYHWIIMLLNVKYDYVSDFPLDEYTLTKHISSNYENPHAIHHYVNQDGYIVNSDYPGALPVTCEEIERAENEAKRTIKLISPQLLGVVLRTFKTLL